MITGYADNGCFSEAVSCFRAMQQEGFGANSVTLVSVLNACSNVEDGRFIHEVVTEAGLESDSVVSNALVKMYGKAGLVEQAHQVFSRADPRTASIVSWNSMMSVFIHHERNEEALKLWKQMLKLDHVVPDSVSFVLGLTACADLGAFEDGKQIHQMVKDMSLESNIVIGNCLLHFYGKSGCIEQASVIFQKLSEELVSCNAMIGAFAQSGDWRGALRVFQGILHRGLRPGKVTFAALLDGCADSSSLGDGERIHQLVSGIGLELDVVVGTALLNMYGRCGVMERAQEMFDRMGGNINEVSFTALFAAYAQRGHFAQALKLFRRMKQEGMRIHGATFVSVLNAFSHAGLLEECLKEFAWMRRDHGVEPRAEHHGCIIDLLGRLGMLEEAEKFMRTNVPGGGNHLMWTSFLSSCRNHEDIKLARKAAMKAEKLAPQRSASYVVLSNTFTSAE